MASYPNATDFINNPPCTDRVNGDLSNWPTPPSREHWAFISVSCYLTLFTVWCLFVFVFYTRYKHAFPCNLTSYLSQSVTTLMSPLVYFNYVQGILVPWIPCWAHVLLSEAPYIMGWALINESIRLYVTYNSQHFLSMNNTDNWFVRKKNFILGGIKVEIFAAILVLTLISPDILARYLGVADYSDLLLPMYHYRCSSLTTTQFSLKVFAGLAVVFTQKRFAVLVKDVKEAYPFRSCYRKVGRNNSIFIFSLHAPFFIKQFWVGIDRDVFNTLCWCCSLIWATVFCMNPYLVTFQVAKDARKIQQGKMTIHASSSRKSASVKAIDEALAGLKRAKTTAELREILLSKKEIALRFKEYLVREFCVENMAFVIDLQTYKSKPSKAEANAFAERFLAVGSAYEINVSSHVKKSTMKAIEDGGGPQDGTMTMGKVFDRVEEEVYLMLVDPFNRFVTSVERGRC